MDEGVDDLRERPTFEMDDLEYKQWLAGLAKDETKENENE